MGNRYREEEFFSFYDPEEDWEGMRAGPPRYRPTPVSPRGPISPRAPPLGIYPPELNHDYYDRSRLPITHREQSFGPHGPEEDFLERPRQGMDAPFRPSERELGYYSPSPRSVKELDSHSKGVGRGVERGVAPPPLYVNSDFDHLSVSQGPPPSGRYGSRDSYGQGAMPNDNYGQGVPLSDNYRRGAPLNDIHAGRAPPNDYRTRGAPPNDTYVQRPPPNDNHTQGASPNDKRVRGAPPNDNYAQGVSPNDLYARGAPRNDNRAQGASPNDIYARGASPNGNHARGAPPNDNYRQAAPLNDNYRRGAPSNSNYERGVLPNERNEEGTSPHGSYGRGVPPDVINEHGAPPNRKYEGRASPNDIYEHGVPPNDIHGQGSLDSGYTRRGRASPGLRGNDYGAPPASGARPPYGEGSSGARPPYGEASSGIRPPYGEGSSGARPPYGEASSGYARGLDSSRGRAPLGDGRYEYGGLHKPERAGLAEDYRGGASQPAPISSEYAHQVYASVFSDPVYGGAGQLNARAGYQEESDSLQQAHRREDVRRHPEDF